MKNHIEKMIIGRLEYIDIPDFDLFKIKAKIDTGAYNSSIHVSSIIEFEKDGKKWIKFTILDDGRPEFNNTIYETCEFEERKVKSSNGGVEERYFIKMLLILKGMKLKVKLSLSNRKDLRYPLLLGRRSIRRNFIVDTSKTFTDNK